ncbi:helix-turn-helix domain-containing protein [Streptomyces sp. NPDC087851]|uniref:helix-turn-helix domain-containing protein n=1 Tax=Streptomyces sp. NPDC087851 TaxID=3365810 RepID=UPI0037FF5FA0
MRVTTGQHHPGEHPHVAAEAAPRPGGEDLGVILARALKDVGKNQKDLAAAVAVSHSTLNHWVTGKRGTSRADPEIFRRMAEQLRAWGSDVTVRELFQAVGRRVPGPTDREREQRLLDIYRSLPVEAQRALVQTAEAMKPGAISTG